MTPAQEMFMLGTFVFASICVAFCIFLVLFWISLRIEDAWDDFNERKRMKRLIKRIKGK